MNQEIVRNLVEADRIICDSIEHAHMNRGFFSKVVLTNLRTFIEQASLYAYSRLYSAEVEDHFLEIKRVMSIVRNEPGFKVLGKLHDLLQIVASHYSVDYDSSERLMLDYKSYLYEIRTLFDGQFGVHLLDNLEKYPSDMDSSLEDYYGKVACAIDAMTSGEKENSGRFYVYSKKTFFVDGVRFFEITLTPANDYSSKFDRILVFSKTDILENYAIKARLQVAYIMLFGIRIRILVLVGWEVSIRLCEIHKFLKIIKPQRTTSYSSTMEYRKLMIYMTNNRVDLVDIVTLPEKRYKELKKRVLEGARSSLVFDSLDEVRRRIVNHKTHENVLRYVLNSMNNTILYNVLDPSNENQGLYIKTACYPFELMPFVTSLPSHNPRLTDLLNCIPLEHHEFELSARHLITSSRDNNELFIPEKRFESIPSFNDDIELYNQKIFGKHIGRKISLFRKHWFLEENDSDILSILMSIRPFVGSGIADYSVYVSNYFSSARLPDNFEEKRTILNTLFSCNRIAFINGSAGTGKSTLLGCVSKMFFGSRILALTQTNSALKNLRERLGDTRNIVFKNTSEIVRSNTTFDCDILIVDECSTVSNRDMCDTLKKVHFGCCIFSGDVYQIESILFGNWFELVQRFVPTNVIHTLSYVHRTADQFLLKVWELVRDSGPGVTELLSRKDMSTQLSGDIFKDSSFDVRLCLNYGGLYGVNAINNICQQLNPQKPIEWKHFIYKINDPVIFSENSRFGGLIRNNQKGRIVSINNGDNSIIFDVQLEGSLGGFGSQNGLVIIGNNSVGTVVRIEVVKSTSDDEDSSAISVVPFDVSYAITIHKAQGLEFDNVAIVISNDLEDRISHNIFYTAITRSKKHFKVFWQPETQFAILSELKHKTNKKDYHLFKLKHSL